MSQRPAPSILLTALVAAGVALPGVAHAQSVGSPSPIFPAPGSCSSAEAPAPESVAFAISPSKVKAGAQTRLKYVIVNVGKTCLGYTGAPYGLQISGFAGWSNIPWNTGFWPQYVRYIAPGQAISGTTAPLPKELGAGGYYRVIPKFTPDAVQPVAGALLTVV